MKRIRDKFGRKEMVREYTRKGLKQWEIARIRQITPRHVRRIQQEIEEELKEAIRLDKENRPVL